MSKHGDDETEDDKAGHSTAANTARNYYNSDDAEYFYSTLWGGEDIHVGLYESDDHPVVDASNRTVERMGELVHDKLVPRAHVLDIGGGYGGPARYLAEHFDVNVVSLNLSDIQNERARRLTADRHLDDRVSIVDGDFENICYNNASFDVVWSQDAMLHSGNRARVLEEVARVLKPGGVFVFTDPMAADGIAMDELQPVLARLDLDSMSSPGFYREELARHGLTEQTFEDHTDQLTRHYDRIHRELDAHRDELNQHISQSYLENMKKGLKNWVEAGSSGKLAWGIMVFNKQVQG